jgi:predicted nucleotidyltransferase component of viral defense system
LITTLLSKQQLSLINKNTLCYRLAEAEKDYMLALVLGFIYKSKLKKDLVFKGGTAIYHCYLPQMRFSEDLDFTSLSAQINMDDIEKVFKSEDFLEISKKYESDSTLKIERLKYQGPLDMSNSLKIEIDFKQNVLLPAIEKTYNNVWGIKFNVKVMDIREVSAEKLRAMSDRARYRDFYDQYMISRFYNINFEETYSLVKKKEIREPISHKNILFNWQIAKEEKTKELQVVYYKEEISNNDIEQMIKNLSFADIMPHSEIK